MYLGKFGGESCFISQRASNQSVCLTGISGGGKTCRLQRIELEAVKSGDTVIVLDIHRTHSKEQIFSEIREEYVGFVNRIHALEDGLNLGFFEPMKNGDGKEESFVNLVSAAVQTFSEGQHFGPRQIEALREAVIRLIERGSCHGNEAEALSDILLKQKTPSAKAVYGRLWPLLNCGALRSGEKYIQKGAINIFDFGDLSEMLQRTLAELVLCWLWRRMVYGEITKERGGLCLVLDEFQNFSLKPGAPLLSLLKEGRKFGVNLVLATQTLSVFPKEILAVVNQTASHLYFQPASNEIRKIARELGGEKAEEYRKILFHLKRGECLARGSFSVGGAEIRRPLLLR